MTEEPETLVLTITPTAEIVTIDGARCRLWNGSTIDGTRCGVFVACIGVAEGANTEKFDRALKSIPRPACDSSSAAMTRSGVAGS